MKVRVDATKCQAFGLCAGHLPEVFEQDEWGYASAIGDGAVPTEKEYLALAAINDCPEKAISELKS